MASSTSKNIKEKLLLLFLLVSILLIGIIWAEGLTDSAPATPSYYRDTFQVDESFYLTVTAQIEEYEAEILVTPERP
jgi:hypothetical protein